MLVVPDAVGADALLIHEKFPRLDVGDFREPADGEAEQRPHAVLDHHPGMDALGQVGEDRKIQFGRRDPRQIARVGKKVPRALQARAQDLRGLQCSNHERA